MLRLEMWYTIGGDTTNLVGLVYDHPTIPNGSGIRTSPVLSTADELRTGSIIHTANSTYLLGSSYEFERRLQPVDDYWKDSGELREVL